jgi:phosphoglycolate phosphatase
MATATAKLTPVARAILEHHDLTGYFAVVNGTDEHHHTKTETLAHTLDQLGRPPAASVLMVGDRHSDVTAAISCGVTPVAVSWGYGSEQELRATAARLIDTPEELLELSPLRGVPELAGN